MLLSLNPSSGVPLYRQIWQQLRERILSGQMPPGEQLPSVRELSTLLQINPLTAAKVYQYLERDGLVETRRGQGTFVALSVQPLPAADQEAQIQPALRQFITEALHLGLQEKDILSLVKETYKQLKSPNHHE